MDRAGELVRCFWFENDGWGPSYEMTDEVWDEFDQDEIVDAFLAITWWRHQHAAPLSRVAANLRYHVAKEDAKVERRLDVTQRLKRRNTMINKLDRGKDEHAKLSRMHDIGGVRARLPTIGHVQAVSRRLKKTWTIHRTRDYIAEPKESGYRAIHHIVKRDNRFVEVQLRTIRQDAWANQVENDGRAQGVGFKFGFGDDEVHGYYRAMAEAFAFMDRDEEIPDQLVEELSERFMQVGPGLGRMRRREGS